MYREELNVSHCKKRIYIRLKQGALSIKTSKAKKYLMCGLFVLLFLLYFAVVVKENNRYSWLENFALNCQFAVGTLVMISFVLIMFSNPIEAWKSTRNFIRAGLVNSVGEPPILISIKRISSNNVLYVFESVGISLEYWEKHRLNLENAFDMSISGIRIGKNMREIEVLAFKGKYDYDKTLLWESHIDEFDEPEIGLGEAMGEVITLKLDEHAHVLVGGATGSGKTCLVQLMLMQCILKGYMVVVADVKGGGDYSLFKNKCDFLTDEESINGALDILINEMIKRSNLLNAKMCKSVDDYNSRYEEKIPRIVFACDEVAELLDTTGVTKAEKELITQISSKLKTLARMARSTNIHLILATQRPDMDIIPGQIKNNITYRVSGRADSILSKIILDKTEASTLIPNNAKGVFLNQDGVLFKAYYVSDKEMEERLYGRFEKRNCVDSKGFV